MKRGSVHHVLFGSWLLLMVMVPTLLAEAVVYIDDDAAVGGDGTSWQTAYRYLQDGFVSAALQSSPEPVELRLAQGIYKPDQDAASPQGTGNQDESSGGGKASQSNF